MSSPSILCVAQPSLRRAGSRERPGIYSADGLFELLTNRHKGPGPQSTTPARTVPPSGGADDAAHTGSDALPASTVVQVPAVATPATGTPYPAQPVPRSKAKSAASVWAARTFDSLQVRDFRLLWIGMLLTMGGMNMQMFTRGLQAYDLTDSAVITAVVSMGWAPTMLVFSLYGGVLGERLERRSLIQFAQICNAIIPAVLAVLSFTGVVHWWHLFAASMVQGIMFATMTPARQAIIPGIVGKERVSNALALNASAMGLMNIAGQAFGGILYDLIGPEGSYVTATLMTVMAVWFTMQLPKMYPEKKNGPRRSAFAEITDGLRYINRTPMVRVLLLQGLVVTLLAMPFRMLIQVFAKEVYGSSASQIGVLGAVAGIGAVAGSLWIAGLRPGQGRGATLLATSVLGGVALILAGGLPWLAVGILAMVLAGLGESGRMALGQSLVIENADDAYRSRVTSVLMMTFGLMPLAVLPLGVAYDTIGARPPIIFMGGLLLVFCAYFIFFQPKLRRLP